MFVHRFSRLVARAARVGRESLPAVPESHLVRRQGVADLRRGSMCAGRKTTGAETRTPAGRYPVAVGRFGAMRGAP